jgi:hypothetical protein
MSQHVTCEARPRISVDLRREGAGSFWSDREFLQGREVSILPQSTQRTWRGRNFPANPVDHDLSRQSCNSVGGLSCPDFLALLLRLGRFGGSAGSCVSGGLSSES